MERLMKAVESISWCNTSLKRHVRYFGRTSLWDLYNLSKIAETGRQASGETLLMILWSRLFSFNSFSKRSAFSGLLYRKPCSISQS